MDRDRLIKVLEIFRDSNPYEICDGREFRAIKEPEYCMGQMIEDTIALLNEQDELLHKKQKDVDRLCNEISEWKHKYHDRPLKDAVEPFHRCIGKDFILIEDSHFDYCPYCGKPITWAKQEGR